LPVLPVEPLALLTPITRKEAVDQLTDPPALVDSDGLIAANPALTIVDRPNKNAGPMKGDAPGKDAGKVQGVPVDLIAPAGGAIPPAEDLILEPIAPKLAQARRALSVGLQTDASNVRLESKALKAAAEFEGTLKDAMQAKLSSAGEMATRLPEPAERPRGRSFGGAGSTGVEGGWAQYAHHARTGGDPSSSLTFSATAPAQTQVADKVSYWVTQGIQNAELKLEGFGDEPVEVSIILKGGEARVDFRSDQPEVRQMLEGALGQLKDSLHREGVLLSGVTVGGSGSGADGERQQDHRKNPGANQKRDEVRSITEARVQRSSTSVGRSLDIFV
jgi:flagellar hook-length control protein FliK